MTSPDEPMVEWLRYPEAEAFIDDKLEQFVSVVPPARALRADLMVHASSRLVDWLDHLILADGDAPRGQLADLGFEPLAVPAGPRDSVYHHPGALFAPVVLRDGTGAAPGDVVGAAIQVEDVSHFLMAYASSNGHIQGSPLSPYRRARIWQFPQVPKVTFWVVERRGHRGLEPVEMSPGYAQLYLRAFEQWATRPRQFDDARQGMAQTLRLAQSLVSELGTNTAAWVAFEAERAYWQRRNEAGQIQRGRQERLGMGWANHDHHTFRSSRETFEQLIQILETFGFRPRERFYAGAEAGWGAQVMEQPACRFAVFADVDLSPEEVEGDFAHRPLAPRQELGTVGLWCALHGESMLGAGLHHLASRLDFDTATEHLAEWGVDMMRPFSDFGYLRQAFTRGERWEVPPERIERLLAAGQIDHDQAERFAQEGAVGSHLENIQRGEGFKGFNQQTISDIIRRTDPRTERGGNSE